MRFFPRLLLTQAAPLLIVVVAVALVFASTGRVTATLADLRDHELSALRSEAALHRAGWGVDVAMRRATQACYDDASDREGAAHVRRQATLLESTLGRTRGADPEMRRVIRAYTELAAGVSARAPCQALLAAEVQQRRSLLDEQLTDAWVGRMTRLHEAVIARDEEARRAAQETLAGGLVLIAVALALALVVSLTLARSVTSPLQALRDSAVRLGGGTFAAPVLPVRGPQEVVELGQELEAMRVRLAELDSLKQGFVASVSHEMRTPLSKMREALALLADGAAGALSAQQLRIVKIARDACERQIRTVTSILDLSRLRAGSPLQLRDHVSLDGVLRVAVDDELADAESRGVHVRLEWSGAPPRARVDAVLLERAIANLVRNAVAVSARGQSIEVRREVHERGPEGSSGPFACIRVIDEGPGIPPSLEQSIFLPFVTHAIEGSPKRVGVGLGLSLSREVAEAHAGRLELAHPARGAELRLWIPIEPTARREREG